MSHCARSGCFKGGLHKCSICDKELYCSSDCQKVHWKSHKYICKALKKLSLELQPYRDVVQIIKEIRGEINPAIISKNHLNIKLLGHLISYSKHQFGDRLLEKSYRERDGDQIDNWEVDVKIMVPLHEDLISIYYEDASSSKIDCENLAFPYMVKIFALLKPWSVYFDSNSTSRIDNLSKAQNNKLLKTLLTTEGRIYSMYYRRNQINLADSHCEKAVTYARLLYQGIEEKETDLLCIALRDYRLFRLILGNNADAVTLAEENYNVVAVAYNPVHPKVIYIYFFLKRPWN